MHSELRNLYFPPIHSYAVAQNIPVQWPMRPAMLGNSRVEVSDYDVYLAVDVINFEPETLTTCNLGSRYTWMLQILIYAVEGKGEAQSLARLNDILMLYPVLTELSENGYSFRIIKNADVASPVPTEGWSFIPVRFRIESIN